MTTPWAAGADVGIAEGAQAISLQWLTIRVEVAHTGHRTDQLAGNLAQAHDAQVARRGCRNGSQRGGLGCNHLNAPPGFNDYLSPAQESPRSC